MYLRRPSLVALIAALSMTSARSAEDINSNQFLIEACTLKHAELDAGFCYGLVYGIAMRMAYERKICLP